MVNKLAPPESIKICFEAGPRGYGLARELIAHGFDCEVIAPSRVARQLARKVLLITDPSANGLVMILTG